MIEIAVWVEREPETGEEIHNSLNILGLSLL